MVNRVLSALLLHIRTLTRATAAVFVYALFITLPSSDAWTAKQYRTEGNCEWIKITRASGMRARRPHPARPLSRMILRAHFALE